MRSDRCRDITVVDPIVHGFDLRGEIRRKVTSAGLTFGLSFRRQQAVEGAIEHTDDLCTLVVDDGFELLVPEDRHSEAAVVVWICFEVEFAVASEAVERVLLCCASSAGITPTWSQSQEVVKDCVLEPSIREHLIIHHDELNDILQAFKRSDDVASMCPWAAIV